MALCFTNGVAGYCNQGSLAAFSMSGYDESDVTNPSSGVYWAAPPGSTVTNSSGRTSTSTGSLGFSDQAWLGFNVSSSILVGPKPSPEKQEEYYDLRNALFVFEPSQISATAQNPGSGMFGFYYPSFRSWIPDINHPGQWKLAPVPVQPPPGQPLPGFGQ
jgi:hypothetical protein